MSVHKILAHRSSPIEYMNTNWFIYPENIDAQNLLSNELNIQRATAQVLINRGIKTPEAARKFLSPDISNIPDPYLLPDMDKAVIRIIDAIKNNEKIAIYGDYDVDGLTSTALMVRYLRSLGNDPVICIPDRITEGYGMHLSAIDRLKKQSVNLIITVDCGSKAYKEIRHAKNCGMDVVVADHHEVGDIADDIILLNTKRPDFKHGDRDVAGCTVAFFLVLAIEAKLNKNGILKQLNENLDLLALATIADVVPLKGINRTIVKLGLDAAANSLKHGIRCLIKSCGIKDNVKIKTFDVAYKLAPRINAAGRLGSALKSLDLLLTDDKKTAENIVEELYRLNSERQVLEKAVLEEAEEMIKAGGFLEKPAMVLAGNGWHPGVIGIVASKLVDRYFLPTAIISLKEDSAKGSLRSVSGVNVMNVLNRCSDLLLHYGGHAEAAGVTIELSNINQFRDRFEKTCEELYPEKISSKIKIDAVLKPQDITMNLAKEMDMLEPFGVGNPEPLFYSNEFVVSSFRIVGKNHLKMRLSCPGYHGDIDAIGFTLGDKTVSRGDCIEAIFTPQINEWNGFMSLQLKIKDLKCLK